MKNDFLKQMAQATPKVLKAFPWPSQRDISARKVKLKAIVARLFEVAAEKGTTDVEVLLKGNESLQEECRKSLTDARESELDKWSGQLQKELAASTKDKAERDAEQKEHD